VAASVLQSHSPEKPAVFSGDHGDLHGALVDAKAQVGNVSIFAQTHFPVVGCNILLFNLEFRTRGNIKLKKQAKEFKF
jgi:hypothetical protein